jgi:hypothetical protein
MTGVELWHVEEPNMLGAGVPTIRYLAKRGSSEVSFNKPQQAWRYFQQLTGVPDRDLRPEPPPIECAMQPRAGTRKLRRRQRGRSRSS